MCRVLLGVLLLVFYLVVEASFNYQTAHLVPGIECNVKPAWAWWCAMSAVFCWMAVFVVSLVGAPPCIPPSYRQPCEGHDLLEGPDLENPELVLSFYPEL